ncbi:MAG: NAD-dependent 4,6-dehydratase LegB [Sediminibacterium sp.]
MEIKGKKVIVTGADGFIGSHLVEKLIDEGCKVRAFCVYNSFNSWGWMEKIPADKLSQVEIILGDIRDENGMRNAIRDMDIVFHLAALIAIPFSYHSPGAYIDTNVKGTLNVLQAARDFNTERVLITSTSEVYGTAQYVPIDEKHPRQPQSPYSASKISADSISESFYRSFGIPLTIVRPFNTYGPRQSARAVIPTIIIQLLGGMTKISLGDLSPTRDLLYVKDTVNGFVDIAKSETLIGEDCNIATQSEISIKELAEELISQINPAAQIVVDENRIRPPKSEVFRLFGSNKKITTHTSWEPLYDLRNGIRETIEWFKQPENLVRYKPEVYNI